MRRFAVPAAITAVAIVLLVVLASGVFTDGPNNSITYAVQSRHYKVPPNDDTALPVVGSNATRTLADYRGRFVLVNFFASWCVQCQQESGTLARAEKVMSSHGGTVLGIAYQTDAGTAASYMRTYGVTYPVVTDPATDIASAWGVSGVPDSYLIDPQGKVVWLNVTLLSPNFVDQTLPHLLEQFA